MRTWLLAAAERREFDGVLKRCGSVSPLAWPGAKFAAEAMWKGDRWWMVANGPGPQRVVEMLKQKREIAGMISMGYCGALDPALRLGDVVVSGDIRVETSLAFTRGTIHSEDRVAITVIEKRRLFERTGAIVVEMESAAVHKEAAQWQVPFACIRVVSDTADHDLPLDFNRYRTPDGDFSRTRIALAAVARPFTALPRLIEFDRHCRIASEALGDFLADCRI